MNFQKIHPSTPLRNHSFIKNCMIRLAQITFLIKCINQTDQNENLLPEDTVYAINFQLGVSHAVFHFRSFSFLSLWLLLNFQNICTPYHDFLYLSKSTPSLFPAHAHADSHICKNHPDCWCLDFLHLIISFCTVFLCVLVLGSVPDSPGNSPSAWFHLIHTTARGGRGYSLSGL